MGRILRKRRVGNEDTENLVGGKSGVQALKTSSALIISKENNLLINAGCPKTQTRTVLTDKTNALKQMNLVKQKIGAAAPNLEDAKNSSQKPKETGEKFGKITRRRRSSKENEKEPRKSPQGETRPKPLGDKTNASERENKLLQAAVGTENDFNAKDEPSKDSKPASNNEPISSDREHENIPQAVSLEIPVKKRPPRNAPKFGDGRVSMLRSLRTSKERDTDSQKPQEPNKRARRGAKDVQTREEVSSGLKPKKTPTSCRNKQSDAKQSVQDSSSKHQKFGTLSGESDDSSKTSHDEEVDNLQPVAEGSPLRKLPPRNAAKYEKGWISSLRRSRSSLENVRGLKKSPPKIKSNPFEDQTNSAKEVEKADSGNDFKTGKENAIFDHCSKSKKIAEEAPTASDVAKDLVPDHQKHPNGPLGRRKNRLGSSAQDIIVKEKELDETPEKPGTADASAAESKPRRFKNFESRIAAKLGIDMSGSVSGTKPKDTVKIPKIPSAKETSSRRLRGVNKKIKTYAEAEGSEDEITESPSKLGSKMPGKSPAKSSTVSQKATVRELKNVKASSAPTGVPYEETPSAVVSRKGKDSGSASESAAEIDRVGVENRLKSATSNTSDSNEPEPQPGCSRDSEFSSPLRRTGALRISDCTKKTPLVAPSSSLFSIFKKPETPRRSSLENKIFVSGAKPCPPNEATKKLLPIYGNPNMTPLKKTSALPQAKKEELYDFEVDENEPKPKKKHKPIMKIQRVRAAKRKKPKVYEADPETERRVLKNLDLSPSVFDEFRSAKKKKVENVAGVVVSQTSQSARPAGAAEIVDIHPPDPEVLHHNFDLDGGPMSSPCRDYGQSTPMRNDAPSMLLDDCRDKFGRLSAKVYSPVKSKDSPMRNDAQSVFMDDSRDKFGSLLANVYSPMPSKDSPIPVLMAEYNDDPVRRDDSSRRSIVSNASCASVVSENSIYHDLDVSASTPVKFNKNNSTAFVRQRRKPLELNISNCFGFDEPEIMEEPLVSPIKSTLHVPAHTAPSLRPAPIIKSKLPVILPPLETPAVDVDQVIKQLRFEVGDISSANNSANVSVYDDSEICLKNKSPIKRYFQPKDDHQHKAKEAADERTLDEGDDSFSPVHVAPKVPRLSYERMNKLRKKTCIAPVYKESSEGESAEEPDMEGEPAPTEDIFRPTKNKYVAKKDVPKKKEKGMTKKEEEELEKWAQMFNSQCNQIDGFGLVVE